MVIDELAHTTITWDAEVIKVLTGGIMKNYYTKENKKLIWVISLLTKNLIQLKTNSCHVNNMASSGLMKMLALIKYQHPRCIGVNVSYEYLKGTIFGDRCYGHH